MRKHLITAGKITAFFTAWIITIVISSLEALEEPQLLKGKAAFLRLWWELTPLFGILIVTLIFVYFEKDKLKLNKKTHPLKDTLTGTVLGVIWVMAPFSILILLGNMNIESINEAPYLPIWFLAVLFNAIMQEYLVRGYAFRLLSHNYNKVIAAAVTTVLFVLLHPGAFESGIIAVSNVLTMSIFASLLLILTDSLIMPITVHFLWNGIGRLIFGAVSLADDYPAVFNTKISGSGILTGGKAALEGSIITLILNILLCAAVGTVIYKRKKKESCAK